VLRTNKQLTIDGVMVALIMDRRALKGGAPPIADHAITWCR
jgi:hypothetical protein